jgi:hypothetical protein
MLSATIAWRRDFKPEAITASDVLMMGCTGKVYVQGQDRQGRPIIVMRPGESELCCRSSTFTAFPGYENSPGHPDNFKNLAYTLERACAAGGASKFAILLDFDKLGQSLSLQAAQC